MRSGGERGDRLPGQLRRATRYRTQARFSRLALPHLELAYAEIGSRRGVVGPHPERTPIEIGGGGIFTVQRQHLGQPDQNVVPLRRCREQLRKNSARLGAVVAFDMEIAKLRSQIDRIGDERKPALEHGDSLVEASNFAKLTGIFDKGRRKRRSPRHGPAQPVKRLVAPPDGGQCDGQQGLDLRIVTATRRPLQRDNRLVGAVLHQ